MGPVYSRRPLNAQLRSICAQTKRQYGRKHHEKANKLGPLVEALLLGPMWVAQKSSGPSPLGVVLSRRD